MKTIYKVQVGALSSRQSAENLLRLLKISGFDGFIVEEEVETVKKSSYFKIGNAHIIKTTPDNLEIKVIGDTLKKKGVYGINGTFFDTGTAPVTSPNSCVFIAMNEGKAISSNAQFNGWNGPPRATVIYHKSGAMGFRKLTNINTIRNITEWAIGGYMVKPYMDFANEKIPGSINYRTAHTYIGYDKDDNVFLITMPYHMIHEIVAIMDKLGIINAIVLDGGGSSQLNHPDGSFDSTRRINTAIVLKEV